MQGEEVLVEVVSPGYNRDYLVIFSLQMSLFETISTKCENPMSKVAKGMLPIECLNIVPIASFYHLCTATDMCSVYQAHQSCPCRFPYGGDRLGGTKVRWGEIGA